MSQIDERKGSETILVVDDDEDARQAMHRTLDFHGYRALDAEDGENALEVLEDEDGAVDLVVADIVMPEMSGLSLARRIGERFPEVPVLFTSGYTDQGVPDEEDLGPRTHFLEKPMTIRELAAKVREILDGRA